MALEIAQLIKEKVINLNKFIKAIFPDNEPIVDMAVLESIQPDELQELIDFRDIFVTDEEMKKVNNKTATRKDAQLCLARNLDEARAKYYIERLSDSQIQKIGDYLVCLAELSEELKGF
jgi:hypothetical protein